MDTETQLIKRIARAVPSRQAKGERGGLRLRVGIGDDAAIIASNRGLDWVLSCDAFLEGVHFLADVHPPESVGYKSLARATSDLAAMGAAPRLFLLTLALPVGRTGAWLDRFLRGMGRAARTLGMRLAGGDTSKGPAISISITVLGEVDAGKAVMRSGARPGDIIYVSGKLGRAQLGLELMQRGVGTQRRFAGLLRPHLYPRIRVPLGKWLAERRIASAMMDISDGLSTDLSRLTAASGAGARIWTERIPQMTIPARLPRQVPGLKPNPLQMALHGGEDYELLFTLPRRKAMLLSQAAEFSELTAVGEITREKRILLIGADGTAKRLAPQGWDPFRKK
jgi:thiamine-monophosphate kinase